MGSVAKCVNDVWAVLLNVSMECECVDGATAVWLNRPLKCEFFFQKCRGSVSNVAKYVDGL